MVIIKLLNNYLLLVLKLKGNLWINFGFGDVICG